MRADEEVLLDEHFRSLPPLISFSNGRWYGGRLRLMRHARDRRHGDPARPPVRLIEVPDGRVEPGTQENEPEARALLAGLAELLRDPAYARAHPSASSACSRSRCGCWRSSSRRPSTRRRRGGIGSWSSTRTASRATSAT